MKPPAKLSINFARVVEMKSAESKAIVQLHPPIGDVKSGQSHRVFLPDRFAQRHVKRGVLWQIVSGKRLPRQPVRETRPIVNVGRSERLPRQIRRESNV